MKFTNIYIDYNQTNPLIGKYSLVEMKGRDDFPLYGLLIYRMKIPYG